ncbi:MAG: hypothetical protein QG585_291 [Patescibacteria group bacterium]|jgi:cellulose synthase/poly-beta-1,6-N-acetylglucosamine synthase-like glycosyltransferase|nr:hypothetical protein [Patescibacteria group bacterium]
MDAVLQGISYTFIFFTLYFEVFLLISFFEGRKKEEVADDYTPPVTVIVPCFNEETTVLGTVESILNLEYPKENLHIMVVDDGSTDGTLKALEVYKNHPMIEVHTKENGGKFTVLNYAIENAKTDFVGCLDADSFVMPDALLRIMRKFKNPVTMAVTPSTVIHKPKNILQKMQKAEYEYGNLLRRILSIIDAVHITPGPFSFFRKEVFTKIGLFKHAHNTEDMEIAMRMQKHGLKIENADGALVYTVGPETIKKLYKQRVRWTSGFLGNLIDYKEMVFNKKYGDLGVFILPIAVVGLFVTLIFLVSNLIRFIQSLVDHILKWKTVGISMPQFGNFEWFFLNTNTISILGLLLFFMTLFIVTYASKFTNGKWRFSIDALYFILLYSLIAPFWLIKSVYNNLVGKHAPWR